MKYALISDIHANLEALTAVLRAADAAGADRVLCLGDIVGYCADPGACIDLIRERGIECVRGNHDSVASGLCPPTDFSPVAAKAIRWTCEQLSKEQIAWLGALPTMRMVDEQFVMVHAALHPEPNEHVRINGMMAAEQSLEMMPEQGPRICFFGHTHARVTYRRAGGEVSRIEGDEIETDPNGFYLMNPGSVGQPRDGDRRASFALFDSGERTVRFVRCDYDFAAAREKAMAAGLIRHPGLIRQTAKWLIGR